jgi:hypothetical protein
MRDDALDAVRVTAERVGRFASDVEHNGSAEARQRWRGSLEDLRDTIRHARASGFDTEAIQDAAGSQPRGRFVRPPVSELAEAEPQASEPSPT